MKNYKKYFLLTIGFLFVLSGVARASVYVPLTTITDDDHWIQIFLIIKAPLVF